MVDGKTKTTMRWDEVCINRVLPAILVLLMLVSVLGVARYLYVSLELETLLEKALPSIGMLTSKHFALILSLGYLGLVAIAFFGTLTGVFLRRDQPWRNRIRGSFRLAAELMIIGFIYGFTVAISGEEVGKFVIPIALIASRWLDSTWWGRAGFYEK